MDGWKHLFTLPIDANGLANSLLRHNLSENRSIYFVTGASNGDYLEPDVMRGETQIVAASSIGLVDGTFMLRYTASGSKLKMEK